MLRRNLTILGLLVVSVILLAGLVAAQQSYPPDEQSKSVTRNGSADASQTLQREKISGTIEAFQGNKAVIKTDDGKRVEIVIGPQSFWRSQGYRLNTGAHVEVNGWREDGDAGLFFAAGISGSGFSFELSNSFGYPEWCDPDDYYSGWCPNAGYYRQNYFNPPTYDDTPRWYAYGPRYWRDNCGGGASNRGWGCCGR